MKNRLSDKLFSNALSISSIRIYCLQHARRLTQTPMSYQDHHVVAWSAVILGSDWHPSLFVSLHNQPPFFVQAHVFGETTHLLQLKHCVHVF